jgi:ABC-type dipeptide/oligopeptide/nickel transport system permease component
VVDARGSLRRTATKVGVGAATVFGASIVSFVIMRVLPGDPARLAAGELATEENVANMAASMGLDQPLHVQYLRYIGGFLTGDWGFAYSIGRPARDEILARLPATLELGLLAFVLAVVGAVVLATWAVYAKRRAVDVAVRGGSSLGFGTPPFWIALILLLVAANWLPFLPGPDGRLGGDTAAPPGRTGLMTVDALLAGQWSTALDALSHLLLPAIALAVVPCAFMIRLLRSNLMETSREPYMTVLRAKGTPRHRAFLRHALPNAALPALTAAGLVLAELLIGSVLVEKAFNWPGVGTLLVDSVLRQDFVVVQSFVLLSAVLYVVVNTIVDLLYGVIDPRLKGSAT